MSVIMQPCGLFRLAARARGWRKDAVDLRRHIEIALGESVDFVRPEVGAHLAPADIEVRMMPFGFGHRRDPVYEIDGREPVLDLERLDQLLTVLDLPSLELRDSRFDLLVGQRWRPPAAGHALVIGE